MRVFVIFEFLIVIGLLWLSANIVQYAWFKELRSGRFFCLSNKWIREDDERLEQKIKDKKRRKKDE